MRKHVPATLVFGLCLMVLYLGSYFYFVRPAFVTHDLRTGEYDARPGYGSMPDLVYDPIHWLDRALLRRDLWSGYGTDEDLVKRWD